LHGEAINLQLLLDVDQDILLELMKDKMMDDKRSVAAKHMLINFRSRSFALPTNSIEADKINLSSNEFVFRCKCNCERICISHEDGCLLSEMEKEKTINKPVIF
jgi:hypothetical protein